MKKSQLKSKKATAAHPARRRDPRPTNGSLTISDHRRLAVVLKEVLQAHACGLLRTEDVGSGLHHMIAATDKRNLAEFRRWLERGTGAFSALADI